MMDFLKNKLTTRNIIFIVIIVLLVIPNTRQQIQIALHKGIALINPVSTVAKEERVTLDSYDWKLLDENKSAYDFNKAKGSVTLINFWATWCPPCIAEMPSLQQLYDHYGDDIEFLFVTNESAEIVEAFKLKYNYTFPVYIRRSNAPRALITQSIPRTVIINKYGEIIIDKTGAVDWNSEKVKSQLDQLLAE